MHSGDLLVDLLKQLDVEYVFGLPGGQTLPLYDAIHRTEGITHIGVREERTAAYAAVSYSRMTNKVGVCDATVGPGAAQFISGLGEAYNKSLPIVAIFSDIPTVWESLRDRGSAWQAFYQLDMVKPFVKWSGQVTSQSALPDMVRTAFIKANSGRPGPVVLSIPANVFYEEWDGTKVSIPNELGYFPRSRPVAETNKIEKASKLLLNAKKPVIIAGGGTMISKAEAEIKKLAEKLHAPVLQTLSGRGALEDTHPMGIGLVGKLGTQSSQELIEQADLCFLIGNKSAENSTFEWALPAKHQKVIHLDIDDAEIGKVFHTDVGLHGDAKATLTQLNALLEKQNIPKHILDNRLEWVQKARANWEDIVLKERKNKVEGDHLLNPQEVIHQLNQITSEEDIVISDASFSLGWAGVYYKQKAAGRRIVTPIGIAGLGAGLPMAIGASIAFHKQREVYLIAGDGGFAYSLGELASLQKHGIKVTMIVLDNENWGWVEFVNKLSFDKAYMDLEKIEYATVAEGFGITGYRVQNKEELIQALRESRNADRSSVIHVSVPVWTTPVLDYKPLTEK